jgi:hypothetical protein
MAKHQTPNTAPRTLRFLNIDIAEEDKRTARGFKVRKARSQLQKERKRRRRMAQQQQQQRQGAAWGVALSRLEGTFKYLKQDNENLYSVHENGWDHYPHFRPFSGVDELQEAKWQATKFGKAAVYRVTINGFFGLARVPEIGSEGINYTKDRYKRFREMYADTTLRDFLAFPGSKKHLAKLSKNKLFQAATSWTTERYSDSDLSSNEGNLGIDIPGPQIWDESSDGDWGNGHVPKVTEAQLDDEIKRWQDEQAALEQQNCREVIESEQHSLETNDGDYDADEELHDPFDRSDGSQWFVQQPFKPVVKWETKAKRSSLRVVATNKAAPSDERRE